jgi:hypothetical protein
MSDAYRSVHELSDQASCDMRIGAYGVALRRLGEAYACMGTEKDFAR